MRRVFAAQMIVLLCWVMAAVTVHVLTAHDHSHGQIHCHNHDHSNSNHPAQTQDNHHDESDCPVCEFDFASFLGPQYFDNTPKLSQATLLTSFGYWESPFLNERQALSLRGPPQLS